MKLTLEAIEVIDAIARCGTFVAAAEELNKVPSALSYVVQKVESDLGVIVFDRTGHRVRLTNTGKLLLQRGRHVLRQMRDIECQARRSAQGWETELRIAVDTVVPFRALVPYISAFYGETSSTYLRFSHEVLGGSWDALHSRRADLVVGAVGDPPFAGVATKVIGRLPMVYCVAPGHPLASAPEPLDPHEAARYRAIVIGDTSRQLAARSLGLFEGQEVLTVQCLEAKLQLQLASLGAGYLPLCIAKPFLDRGRLVGKNLATPPPPRVVHLAWYADFAGEALSWWIRQLGKPNLVEEMWLHSGPAYAFREY